MKRNITLSLTDKDSESNNIVSINNLNSIVNHSYDSIVLNCLEFLPSKDHDIIIKIVLDKLRIGGRLIIEASNAASIAQQFVSFSISNDEFLNFFSNKKSLLSLENLYTLVDFNSFEIVNTNIEKNNIKLILERKNI